MNKIGSLKPEVLAIIPARGGSKGVPRKNTRMFAGKPLIAWTIEAATQSAFIDRAVVSTEDKEIAQVSKDYGIEVIDRPAELAQDDTHIVPVMEHVIQKLSEEGYRPVWVVLLNPTSPLRNKDHLDMAVRHFMWSKCDSVVSVTKEIVCLWELKDDVACANYDYEKKPRRQDSKPSYRENGAMYMVRTDFLMREHKLIGGKVNLFQIAKYNDWDIDTELDFKIGELVMLEIVTDKS